MQHTWECTSLSQANATILTGFHFASLRHSFSSVAFSPPAANNFARRLSPLRLRSACIRTAHSLRPFRLRLLGFTCIVQPPPYPDGKYTPAASYGAGIAIHSSWLYCQPLVGARSHLRSFLSSVAYGGSPPTLQCGQVCRTAILLFCRRRFYRQASHINLCF